MAPKQPNVFVSMGTPYTDKQTAFRATLLDVLRAQGIVPRMLNQTEYPPGSPLPHIRSLIGECDGVLVVAYERKHVDTGAEKNLIGINIADAGDERLIHEGGFYFHIRAAGEPLLKNGKCEVFKKRLRPKMSQVERRFQYTCVLKYDFAEFSGVGESQMFAV